MSSSLYVNNPVGKLQERMMVLKGGGVLPVYKLTRVSSFLNSRYIERNIGKKPPETYYYDVGCPWLVDGASKCPTLTMMVTLGKTVVVSSM